MYGEIVERVHRFFTVKAQKFDGLYEMEKSQRILRPALFQRRDRAVQLVRSRIAPRVLDLGCGSGRVGEALLDAGASQYVGVDLSGAMLAMARERLARFGVRAQLVEGDYCVIELDGAFDLVVALGLFEYLPEPYSMVSKMLTNTSPGSALIASFPTRTWFRGPIRRIRYELLGDCPINDYDRHEIERLFQRNGIWKLIFARQNHCFLVIAERTG